jgi:DNA-binding transcriptional LysR family regulator
MVKQSPLMYKGAYAVMMVSIFSIARLKGLGICFDPSIVFKEHIDNNALCLLLEDYMLPAVSISAIYPLNRNLSRRVRVLIDFLAQKLSA